MSDRLALFLDGGFVKSKLASRLGRTTGADEVQALCAALLAHPCVADCRLLRTFFYDAPPFTGTLRHPVTGHSRNHARDPGALANQRLHAELAQRGPVALRLGAVQHAGWRLSEAGLERLAAGEPPTAEDVVPDLRQGGVDMLLGLDLAWVAARRLVDAVLVVTGDADFVPALKLARREGLRVYLYAFAHHIQPALAAHSDGVLPEAEVLLPG